MAGGARFLPKWHIMCISKYCAKHNKTFRRVFLFDTKGIDGRIPIKKVEGNKMLKKFVDTKAQIWGSESHACTIVYEVSTQRYYAVCDEIGEEKRLTENNYERVLNDLFYDYCVANAAWMGVS